VHINDKSINLTPAMEVTAEIRTGRRNVAGYFLDPLVQTAGESLREGCPAGAGGQATAIPSSG